MVKLINSPIPVSYIPSCTVEWYKHHLTNVLDFIVTLNNRTQPHRPKSASVSLAPGNYARLGCMSEYLLHWVFESDSLLVPRGKNRAQTFTVNTNAVEVLLWVQGVLLKVQRVSLLWSCISKIHKLPVQKQKIAKKEPIPRDDDTSCTYCKLILQ